MQCSIGINTISKYTDILYTDTVFSMCLYLNFQQFFFINITMGVICAREKSEWILYTLIVVIVYNNPHINPVRWHKQNKRHILYNYFVLNPK